MIPRKRYLAGVGLSLLFLGIHAASAVQDDQPARAPSPTVIGRWDLTVHGPEGDYPSWLEVRRSGRRTLVGEFVGRFGSARPISRVEFDQGQVRFTVPPQWEERKDDLSFEGRLEGETLRGETTDDQAGASPGPPAGPRRSNEPARRPGGSRWSCSTATT
jgi:hypothetical protein